MASIGPVTVTPLAGNELHCRSLTGGEGLGQLFEYNVELLCLNPNITLSEALGQNMTVTLEQPNGLRHFNGYVSRFSFAEASGKYTVYRATLHPWLWFLSTTADCRIYPEKTVPEIVKRVFGRYPQALFEGELPGFTKRNYVVQYRETDLNFVSRLMEEEGIYYYFKHDATKHTLVFADSIAAHHPVEGGTIAYHQTTEGGRRLNDYFDRWRVTQEIQPGGYLMKGYDFVKPRGDLLSVSRPDAPTARTTSGEVYDYPGGYTERADGDTRAAIRINELHTLYETIEATGVTPALGVGQLFTLTDFPRLDQNHQYLAVRARYEIRTHELESGSGANEEIFRTWYSVIDSQQQFRPGRNAPKPVMQGPQTAIVVGDKKTKDDGTEIWTDEYARVRVRFYWERLGAERQEEKDDQDLRDEDNTCWVRVSQVWAGAKWGALHVPRIGQEVIVDFLDGDPDQPIVTGRVYNGDNLPPFLDPSAPTDTATQSGVKSRSTPKGGPNNFNEIRFEDKKGKEELHIQAERDQSTHVKRNQSISVDGDRSVSVGGNESISVTGTRTSTITQKETQIFKADREMKVTGTNTDDVAKLHTGNYHAGRTEMVEKGPDKLTVDSSGKTVTVHGTYNTVADTQFQVKQKENSITIKDKITVTNGGQCTITLDGGKASIDASEEISIICGSTSISLKAGGELEIKGMTVKIGNANNNAAFEPAGTTVNGVKITSAAVGIHEVNGALIKIG
jgi:type VI secretion system secreted protein VgrG